MPHAHWKRNLAALLLAGTGGTAGAQTPGPVPYLPGAAGKPKLCGRPPWPSVPAGSSVEMYFQTHITNGVATRMALYDYDFLPDSAQLNYRGKDRVHRIAGLAVCNQFPIVVERLPANPALAEARKRAVLTELAAAGPINPDRVVVGAPLGAPLQGVEAEVIYQNLLRQLESAGKMPSTGVGSGTTTTGTSPIGSGAGAGAGGTGTGTGTGR